MATVVEEEEVARFSRSNEIGKGLPDILACGLGKRIINVNQDSDIILGEAIAFDEASVHMLNVVDASLNLRLHYLRFKKRSKQMAQSQEMP